MKSVQSIAAPAAHPIACVKRDHCTALWAVQHPIACKSTFVFEWTDTTGTAAVQVAKVVMNGLQLHTGSEPAQGGVELGPEGGREIHSKTPFHSMS